MTTEDFKRKLTAILSADVEGYSRLMGDDEDSTIRTLTSYRNLMSSLIERHHGQVVDSPGDNLLAEFESVRDAVLCAVEIQEELKVRNADLPNHRKMQFRIGINLGDIIKEEDRIYGDGVNIAARIESLADAGGICLSRSAYDQVKKKLNYEYEHLGEYEVKNIDEPVNVYKVLMVSTPVDKVVEEKKISINTSSKRNIAIILIVIIAGLLVWRFYPTTSIKTESEAIKNEQVTVTPEAKEAPNTIAVLPFNDDSPEKDQEYFCNGVSEELINKLSQVKDLLVTARTSSFAFKGKNVDIRSIGETLGVTYIMEGSVRKSVNQVRVTAQLIKAADGYHLWSKTYDRELEDIFTIQDDIAKEVTTALSVTLGVGEFNRPGLTRDIKAYDEYLRANAKMLESTPDSWLETIDHVKNALEIDPKSGLGWLSLSIAYNNAAMISPPEKASDFMVKATEAFEHARAISPNMPELRAITAQENERNGNWLEAERIWKEIIEEQGHSGLNVNRQYGNMLLRAGRSNDALQYFKRAKRLNPMASDISLSLSFALINLKRNDEALAELRRGRTLEGYDWAFEGFEELITLDAEGKFRFSADLLSDVPDAARLRELLLAGDREASLSELKELSKDSNIPLSRRSNLANIASILGDPELAFKNFCTINIQLALTSIWGPESKDIRKLPAFKIWIREIGLYDYWRTGGEWGDFCRPVGDDDFECD